MVAGAFIYLSGRENLYFGRAYIVDMPLFLIGPIPPFMHTQNFLHIYLLPWKICIMSISTALNWSVQQNSCQVFNFVFSMYDVKQP